MWQNRCRHKSVQKYRHILFLALFAAISIAVILLYNQLCRYQFNFLTDIFFANDLHLTSAARTYLLIFGDSAGDDLGLDVLYDLITFCLCTFSDITLDIFLYRLFRFLCIFLFGLVEERLLIFTFGSLALCSEYFMLREYQCFKEDMIIFSETFIFDL